MCMHAQLLSQEHNAPRADLGSSRALFNAIERGHVRVAELLLSWHVNAAQVDSSWGKLALSRAELLTTPADEASLRLLKQYS